MLKIGKDGSEHVIGLQAPISIQSKSARSRAFKFYYFYYCVCGVTSACGHVRETISKLAYCVCDFHPAEVGQHEHEVEVRRRGSLADWEDDLTRELHRDRSVLRGIRAIAASEWAGG